MHSIRNRPRLTLLSGLSALALALAACSGSGSTSSSTPSVSVSDPLANLSEQPTLAAQVPPAIGSTITVGTDATYAPNEFLDKDGKTVIGFDIDLFKAVAATLGLAGGVRPRAVRRDHPRRLVGQVRGRGLLVHDQRHPRGAGQHGELLRRRHPVGDEEGQPRRDRPRERLRQEDRGAAGDGPGEDITTRSAKCTTAGKSAIQIDQYQGQDQATSAVVSGKDQAMLADSPVIAYATVQTSGALEKLGDIYDSAPYGYVVAKDDEHFAQVLRGALITLIDNGTYQDILAKWFVGDGAIGEPQVNPSAAP